MAALSPAQINALHMLDQTFGQSPQAVKAGRKLADRMRCNLPDLDDLTIGRTLLEAGEFVASVWHTAQAEPDDTAQGEAALMSVAATLACAAIHLTELHWKKELP